MNNLVGIKSLLPRPTNAAKSVEVLHGIDLDIAAGDFVALMGPSGSARPPC